MNGQYYMQGSHRLIHSSKIWSEEGLGFGWSVVVLWSTHRIRAERTDSSAASWKLVFGPLTVLCCAMCVLWAAGNDFSTLYAPLIRDGRMEKYYWNPTREDRIGVCMGIFQEDQVGVGVHRGVWGGG